MKLQAQITITNGRKSFWLSRKPCLKKRLLPYHQEKILAISERKSHPLGIKGAKRIYSQGRFIAPSIAICISVPRLSISWTLSLPRNEKMRTKKKKRRRNPRVRSESRFHHKQILAYIEQKWELLLLCHPLLLEKKGVKSTEGEAIESCFRRATRL